MDTYQREMQALRKQYDDGQTLFALDQIKRNLGSNPNVPGGSRYTALVDWDAKTVTLPPDDETCPYCGGINTHDHCPNCGAPKRRMQ